MSSPETKKSFFSNLWERRFFQFFATYIAASWGAIQFLEWGVKRYDLPSVWVDKLVVFLLIMLPLVICVIYLHGKPGADKWWKLEKIFYPINFIFALMMSMFLVNSSGNDITEEVTIVDIEGQTIVREVPKAEHNKKIVIYPVESSSDLADWKDVGVSELLNNKLEQDMRIIVSSALSVFDDYENYGYDKMQKIPFATKQNIAVDHYSDYFVASKFVEGDGIAMEVKIYDTDSGKLVSSLTVDGDDIFGLVEKTAVFINEKVKIAEVEGKELYVDLPASNLITTDTTALRLYMEGVKIMELEPAKTAEAQSLFEASTKQDPTCGECWIRLSVIKLLSAQDQELERSNALKYADNLPERQQLNIKYFNYLAQNDTDKAIKLCEMWRKLYPQDSKPVSNLISLYGMTLRPKDAKVVAKEAIENGHKGSIYLSYANLLIKTKDWDEAEKYLKIYKEAYPKQFEATSLLVDTYAGKGQMKNAIESLDELILMKPNDKNYQYKKAELFTKENKFEEAISVLHLSLMKSETSADSISNLVEQLKVYSRALKFEEFGKARRKLRSVFFRTYPPASFVQTEYGTVGYYTDIGYPDSIRYHLDGLINMIPPSNQAMLLGVNDFILKFYTKDVEGIDQVYEKIKPMFANLGSKIITLVYDSEIEFMKGNYEEAIKMFAESKDEATDISMISNSYHDAHIILGKYTEGLEVVNDILKDDPLNPVLNYYKSLFLSKLGKDKDAKDALQPYMKIFKESDQRYKYTKKALELASQLGL